MNTRLKAAVGVAATYEIGDADGDSVQRFWRNRLADDQNDASAAAIGAA